MSDRLPANGQNQITVWTGPDSDQILTSDGTAYNLILQADGNLTIWAGIPEPTDPTSHTAWSSDSHGNASRAIMKDDGDFVVLDTNDQVLWETYTTGHPGSYVILQDNGSLVVYDPKNLPLWASEATMKDISESAYYSLIGTQQVSEQAAGVMGVSHKRYGVFGHSTNSDAIHGETDSITFSGVTGIQVNPLSTDGAGVWGESKGNGDGVHGQSDGTGAAIAGVAKGNGDGLRGESDGNGAGVWGESKGNGDGVHGQSDGTGTGVWGHSEKGVGVYGETNSAAGAIKGVSLNTDPSTDKLAGFFDGNVNVTGDIRLINSDCAEEFDIQSDAVEPGTVMVLNQLGNLEESNHAYDKKVAGIVSGAGSYKPALVLDKKLGKPDSRRIPIALMGKVYCKVDANYSPIEIGDLLTTSATPGHAMKADDPYKSCGTVIGKALGSIKGGIGIIPVLVALQ